jgi:hypothetical protein
VTGSKTDHQSSSLQPVLGESVACSPFTTTFENLSPYFPTLIPLKGKGYSTTRFLSCCDKETPIFFATGLCLTSTFLETGVLTTANKAGNNS